MFGRVYPVVAYKKEKAACGRLFFLFWKGEDEYMAATRLIALHINKGKTIARCLGERIDYAQNEKKTEGGIYISSYECDPKTVQEEFLLSKRQYQHVTGRQQKNDVIAYQIRQSFWPGEVTPEEANQIGYELAMRFTKGKYAFVVATHTDRAHIHNHVIYNSTALDGSHKFQDFLRSGLAVQKVSDRICAEHGLSVIVPDPARKKKNSGRFLTGQKAAEAALKSSFHMLVDIEAKLAEGKGKGYERWAKKFNRKEGARTICLLKEKGVSSYEELKQITEEHVKKFAELQTAIKGIDEQLQEIRTLQNQIQTYARTRPVYEAYRKAGYSKKFLEENREAIEKQKAAREVFSDWCSQNKADKIPAMKELQQEYGRLFQKKKKLYAEYHQVKKEMKEFLIARQNVEQIMGIVSEKSDQRSEGMRDHHQR